MKLGKLIEALKKRSPDEYVTIADTPVRLYPGHLESYRGYYDQLSVTVTVSGNYETVGAFLKACEAAVGETFEGYKGGTYTMTEDTRVWLSNHGEASGTRITGVRTSTSRHSGCELTWMSDD